MFVTSTHTSAHAKLQYECKYKCTITQPLRITAVPTRDPTQCAVASRKGRPTLQCSVGPHEKAAVYNLKP